MCFQVAWPFSFVKWGDLHVCTFPFFPGVCGDWLFFPDYPGECFILSPISQHASQVKGQLRRAQASEWTVRGTLWVLGLRAEQSSGPGVTGVLGYGGYCFPRLRRSTGHRLKAPW